MLIARAHRVTASTCSRQLIAAPHSAGGVFAWVRSGRADAPDFLDLVQVYPTGCVQAEAAPGAAAMDASAAAAAASAAAGAVSCVEPGRDDAAAAGAAGAAAALTAE